MGIKIPNPKREAEKAIREIVKPAIELGKKEVYNGSKWARDKVGEAKDEAEKAVKSVGHEAEDGVRKVGKEVEEGLTETLPELVTEVLPEAFEAMAKDLQAIIAGPIGEVIFNIAEKAAPGKTTHAIGFVELEMEIRDKIPELRKWIVTPPTSGDDVERMCMDFVGDDVIVVRPMRILEMIPTFPKMPIDPAIPVQVKQIPEIVEELEGVAQKVLEELL